MKKKQVKTMKTQVKTKGMGVKLVVGLAVFVVVVSGIGAILYFSGVIAPEELITCQAI